MCSRTNCPDLVLVLFNQNARSARTEMQSTEASSCVITLLQNGHHISLDDDGLRLLGDVTCRQLDVTDDVLHGYDVRRTRQSLLRSTDGSRIANSGCIPLLQRVALQRNLDLRVIRSSPISDLPESSRIAYLAYPQLARFVRSRERGLIRRSSSVTAESVIYDLALAYPDQRIVVLGDHIRQNEKIFRCLAPKIEGVQCVSGRAPVVVEDDDEMPSVLISTFTQAAEIDFATCDIVLLLDAYDCIQKRAQLALTQIDARFRLFGLVKAGRTVSPSQEDTSMAVFGPEILDIYGFGRSRRDISIAWVDHHVPKVELQDSDRDYWFRCYWHNERRNRRVRQLALALAAGEPLDRAKFADVADWFAGRDYEPQSVAILTDRPLHAEVLSNMLLDWKVFAGDIPLDGSRGSFRNRAKRHRKQWTTSAKQIVLADAARQYRGETIDVVIWAGGGPCAAAIPDSWFRAEDDANKPLLIVDLWDQHNDTSREWSYDREYAYYRRDIFPAGISSPQGRIAMFLHRARGWRVN